MASAPYLHLSPEMLGYAFIGGLLPPLIWLYFLLKEDATHPEPKPLIALTFIAGMLAVPLAVPLEQVSKSLFHDNFSVFTSWALIEELLKYAMAASFILWRYAVDEAPDYVIYLITVALGFAAAENMLFLIHPSCSILCTSDMRFLGANLLHVIASASIGFGLAFSKNWHPAGRIGAAASGLILAIALHTTFNMLIITQGAASTLPAFFLVWLVAVVLFAAFEVLKYFQYRNT